MVDELFDTLNWASKYSAQLNLPTWDHNRDESHQSHMKDMLNIIERIHDGLFDEELLQISKRVSSMEKHSRQKNFVDPWSSEKVTMKKKIKPHVDHPYLKSNIHNNCDKKYSKRKETAKMKNNEDPSAQYTSLIKDNLSPPKSIYLQHTLTSNMSIVPLNADCMLPINILPADKVTLVNNTGEYVSAFDDKESLVKTKMIHKYNYIKPSVSKPSKINDKRSLLLEKNNDVKLKKVIISNVCTNGNIAEPSALKNEQMKEYYTNSYFNDYSSSDEVVPIKKLNSCNKIYEKNNCTLGRILEDYQSNGFLESLSNEVCKETNTESDAILSDSKEGEAVPYNSMDNVPKTEEKVDMRKFLKLYNFSIDPEFMEDELERFSLRLHERISYYMEKEGISLNIGDYMQHICEDKSPPANKKNHQLDLLINADQDSYNDIANEIFNDPPSAASEVMLDSVINAFRNTSFHDIIKAEVLIENAPFSPKIHNATITSEENRIPENQAKASSVCRSPNGQQRTRSEPISDGKIPLSRNSEYQNSYSDDFIPMSSSSSREMVCENRKSEGISVEASVLANRMVVAGTDMRAEANNTSSLDKTTECDVIESSNDFANSTQSKAVSKISDSIRIGRGLDISPGITREDTSTSIQKESMNVSEGELLRNLSDSVPAKDKKLSFQYQDVMAEACSSLRNMSDLSVIANDSESLETGNIVIEPSYSEADESMSSGQMVHIYSGKRSFKNEEMFQLYKENEILRQRLAFMKKPT